MTWTPISNHFRARTSEGSTHEAFRTLIADLRSGYLQARVVEDVPFVSTATAPKTLTLPSSFWIDGTLIYQSAMRRLVLGTEDTRRVSQMLGGRWGLIEVKVVAQSASPSAKEQATGRPRGPKPVERERVKTEMRAWSIAELDTMTEEAMAAQFRSNRDTCRKALRSLRSELENSDK